ncbi:MAG: ABC transporter ATP-binding protein [Eubacteriales bacterium]|nr:ABC transporter ATP-binding protein [Eubacteriales bacterium]
MIKEETKEEKKELSEREIKISINHVDKIFNMYNTPMDKMREAFSLSGKKRHTEFKALTDITFDIHEGEILGMVGRNGAGKSTLLKIITGILEPTNGSVKVDGRISSLLELGTGFNMEYTGMENIYFYGTLMGFTKAQMDQKVDDIIAFAEIGDYIHQVVKTYSSGMFARLAFSCAINVDPDILIVDEILSVGDMRFQAKCFNKFKEFKKQGVTILYVGHDVSMMRTFCDRCIWMNNGEIVADGEPTFITAQYTEFMYLDDISDFTTYRKFSEEKQKKLKEKEKQEKEAEAASAEEAQPVETETVAEAAPAEEEKKPEIKSKISEKSTFKDCLAHWGTHVGMVKKVRMLNGEGVESNHFTPYEHMTVEVCFDEFEGLDIENFSAAFSIKNKEGTDLCVKTTYDEKIDIEPAEHHRIRFCFPSMLSNGEYYLVIALENRENTMPTYYEYIEGAKFFKVFSDKKIFGVYDVEAQILLDEP